MSDKKIGIPEWRGLGVSAALHNEVVQNYSDKVAELETALASERAKRQTLIEYGARSDQETKNAEARALAAEATIEHAPHARSCNVETWTPYDHAHEQYDCTCWKSRVDTSALARHDEKVWDDGFHHARHNTWVSNPYRARAAELRAQVEK